MSNTPSGDIRITIVGWGPTAEQLGAIGEQVAAHSGLKRRFATGRTRLLRVEALEQDDPRSTAKPAPPTRFRATLWDGERQCAVHAEGDLANPRKLEITEHASAPHPSQAEFDQAVALLRRNRQLGKSIRDGSRIAYRPIPAVDVEYLPGGGVQRRIAVGLIPRPVAADQIRVGPGEPHEIVAVDLDTRTVVRPAAALERASTLCGVPVDAGQQSTGQGEPGQAWITIAQGGKTVWRFLAVRPSASRGTNGSGIELRSIDYRGKRVLNRAHVPILNVKYDGDACGPYRDWQYEEGMIRADGVDAAPGFRLCDSPAKTIMDTGSDTGNYLGVAVYQDGDEVVLISELQAGWYRYISQWRFGMDGVIRPRFGFAAVESECVCNVHHHHAYWRFDFAVKSAAHNQVVEFNDPPVPSGKWTVQEFENRRPRNPARNRRWKVENTRTGDAYEIWPGENDGVSTEQPDHPFGQGDVWILRYDRDQIDDKVYATGPPYEAGLNAWLTGQPVADRDLVVWYGAHFTHDVHEHDPAEHGHILGPDLKPAKW